MRKVYLDDLPRYTYRGREVIDYLKSIGYKVKGIYNEIDFEVEIVDYKDRYLYIEYLDKPIFKIFTGHFIKCQLGKLLDKKTSDFKAEIGQVFEDDKRNITIVQREIRTRYKKNGDKCNEKWYKYHCNIDDNEDWIVESNLLKGNGCNVCTGKKALLGVNTIWDKARWMCDLGVSEEDAKKYTIQSHQKISVKCPDCGKVKKVYIYYVYKTHSISCICGDGGISYPEKLMFNILEQLNIKFITQLSKTTFEWCGKYKYDFYFKYNGEKYIIETHGEQHYKKKFKGSRTLEQEQENDKIKKELTILNGIKEENYIVINCKYSELDFIKQNILNDKLNEVFDLSIIDWNKVEEYALSNLVKKVCEYKSNNSNATTTEIGKIMKLDRSTIIRYLKQGAKLGWCDYSPELEKIKNYKNKGGLNSKQVEIFKDNKSFGIFSSCLELERQSKTLFGIKISNSGISSVANGKRKLHKGYTFQYI